MEWLVQRVTSIYLGGFAVYLIGYLILNPVKNYATWSAYFANGAVRLAWGLFFVSLLLHAWVGLRSIYLDYLHPMWLRFTVTVGTAVGLVALGLWAADILVRGAA
jgi:succinate dehydrogenase / fumarate reductase membrane anchor subunit